MIVNIILVPAIFAIGVYLKTFSSDAAIVSIVIFYSAETIAKAIRGGKS